MSGIQANYSEIHECIVELAAIYPFHKKPREIA